MVDQTWSVMLALPDSRGEAQAIGLAVDGGRSIFTIDLAQVTDRDSLLAFVGREFLFPDEARGFDVALDLLSDLDWFGNEDGYLVVLRNVHILEDANSDLLSAFLAILPDLCDRWHSRGTPFDVLVVAGKKAQERMRPIVERWNRMIRTTTWNVPMHEVPVIELDS